MKRKKQKTQDESFKRLRVKESIIEASGQLVKQTLTMTGLGKVYVVLLRGVNISGKNLIKMKDLVTALSPNYEHVSTYIQSGNVIIKTREAQPEAIQNTVKQVLRNQFNINVEVMVRDQETFQNIVKGNPFPHISDHSRLFVSFFSKAPQESCIAELKSRFSPPEDAAVCEGHAYFSFPKGVSNSTTNPAMIDRVLKIQTTWRNWRTVLALIHRCEQIVV